MTIQRSTAGIIAIVVAVIIIAPLTAYHYLDPKLVEISVSNGNESYNLSGNYDVNSNSNPLRSANFTSISIAKEANGGVSSMTLSVQELEYIVVEAPNESYFNIQMEIYVVGNFLGNLRPSGISLYVSSAGPMANNTEVYQSGPFQPIPVEVNVSYKGQQPFGFHGPGNHTQNIETLNQTNTGQNTTRYHFLFNTGVVAELSQTNVTYGLLLNITFKAGVNGLSSPMYAQMNILSYNSG